MLKGLGYPSEEIREELSYFRWKIGKRIRDEQNAQEKYERFAAGHDKWE